MKTSEAFAICPVKYGLGCCSCGTTTVYSVDSRHDMINKKPVIRLGSPVWRKKQ